MRAVSDQGDSTERLRRGADESAAHQAELRARAERVIHRGDFNEQVRRGADETAVRNAELRAGARVTRARPATGGQ